MHPSLFTGGGGRAPPDTFTEWGEWTECSKTCGGGARARRRECALSEDGILVNCRGDTLEVGSCGQDPCPGGQTNRVHIIILYKLYYFIATLWSFFYPVKCLWTYSDYNKCSVTCGQGVRQRFPIITQNASQGGEDCPPSVKRGEPEQMPCKEPDCPGIRN